MNTFDSFNSYVEQSIVKHWDRAALTDYKGVTYQYHDVARKIEKLHILFEHSGVAKGDRIAICGRNSAHWAVAFFATLTYGAVVVPILHEFQPSQVHNIVNHSGAKLLFVGDYVAQTIVESEMPGLLGIVNIPDYSLMVSRHDGLTYAREHLNELYGRRFPKIFTRDDIRYHRDQAEELAMINYTSGTTGHSKGVMIPYRSLWGNIDYCLGTLGKAIKEESNTLSILPMAHTYGMTIEFLFPFLHGCHLYFLTRMPSPTIIAEAMGTVHPAIVITVPMVLEKIIRKRILPLMQTRQAKLLWKMPVVNKKYKEWLCQQVHQVLGGNAYEVVVGGAPLSKEIEQFLLDIGFPLAMGYGATECSPLITWANYTDYVHGTCGKAVWHMEVKIHSNTPERIPGEIMTRGDNLMLGYYKDPEATAEAIDPEGWYHTGDLGTMDAQGRLFIRGRKKNMLLGSNGQNIYPEEIEDKLNSMPLVAESLALQSGDKIVALIHPDYDTAKHLGLSEADIEEVMEQHRTELNATLPAFSKLAAVRVQKEEFAKTPKKSIKRYLYEY